MTSSDMQALEVLTPGPLTTVQDHGRPGMAHLGVPPSGALDRPGADLANQLVGNPPGFAVLETTLTGPRLRVLGLSGSSVVLAVTGAPAPITVDGHPASMGRVLQVPAGAVVQLGTCSAGVRSYLAVRGGIAVAEVLGSRSHDLLSGLGPPALQRGQRLPIGAMLDAGITATTAWPDTIDPPPVLPIVLGPRDHWFAPEALELLTGTAWQVSPASNRIGLRLTGPALPRRRPEQLPSEGVVTGSIQIPQDGQPVLFLADHPTTGGYPVIAVVDESALHHAAQARPGTTLRFVLGR
ncbi:biotin-dependent carboxylase-like uncharacterized protein [Nakamurella sp. UYEF19]|uniref:5-oxoprolinase subunit C family protein n=1 Tax=Nakamurella sp. UYEF19 TaxID=1756392 RepID=UPI00339679DB